MIQLGCSAFEVGLAFSIDSERVPASRIPLAQPLVIQSGCSAFQGGCFCATCPEDGLGLAVSIDFEKVPASRILFDAEATE